MNVVSVRVCGGFPVLVHFTVQPAEPDVGINRAYGEIQAITTPTGRNCQWLERKFSHDDHEAIEIAVGDMVREGA